MRTFSALMRGVLAGANVPWRHLFRITLGGTVYGFSDAPDDITWDNGAGPVTYYGADAALQFQVAALQATGKASAGSVALSASDPKILTGIFAEPYRAAPADLVLLIKDPVTGLAAEELILQRGKGDVATIEDAPVKYDPVSGDAIQVSTLTLAISDQSADTKRAGYRFATDADHRQRRDPNDGGFKDVALAGISLMNWGKAGGSSPAGAAGATPGTDARTASAQFFANLQALRDRIY